MKLEAALRDRRGLGHKLIVPYVTGGLGGDWSEVIAEVFAAGADAVEVGIPFSDPVMDGPIIQEASLRALASGATPTSILQTLRGSDLGGPLIVMTYANIAFAAGLERFAGWLRSAGVDAAILPDLPLDEVGEWAGIADSKGVETIMMAAPTTPDDRLIRVCERSRGFVYGVGVMGVTGERVSLAQSATVMADRIKAVTDKPVLIGVGVSDPDQARQACEVADGVIVGSALMRRLLEGVGPNGAADFVAEIRNALDSG